MKVCSLGGESPGVLPIQNTWMGAAVRFRGATRSTNTLQLSKRHDWTVRRHHPVAAPPGFTLTGFRLTVGRSGPLSLNNSAAR